MTESERVSVGGTQALVWGCSSDYGAVLSHGQAYDAASWSEQGKRLAENGIIALAVEDTSPNELAAAAGSLKERGVKDVAFIGASSGAKAAIEAASANPGMADQMVLLSPAGGDVTYLWDCPKLFVASEDEDIAGQVEQMAEHAPGEHNDTLLLEGGAHAQAIFKTQEGERLMQAILERLEHFSRTRQ